MTSRSRRHFIGAVGGALLAALPRPRLRSPHLGASAARAVPRHPFRIRTLTAGVHVARPTDLEPIDAAAGFLGRAKQAFVDAGYEVQTVRIATQPLLPPTEGRAGERVLAALQALDRLAHDRDVLLSIGPLIHDDRPAPGFAEWAAALLRSTERISCSVTVASPGRGVHDQAAAAAAAAIVATAHATANGEGNFRFAAAANCPPGIPFFPVAYHDGPAAFAVGLESAPLVAAAVAEGGPRPAAKARLKTLFEAELGAVAAIAGAVARRERRRYLGIDASPAPGKDASIGAAIEALSHVPFGGASTLEACAAVTDVLKSLVVRTCGYSGLMLPVLEDPVLAQRAAERRFSVRELLLYSSVCGTGLDVVPLPGAASVAGLGALIRDVAALATKLQKPLSARLFPIPGKAVGEAAHFTHPFLTDSVVMAAD